RVARAINERLGGEIARVEDSATVRLVLPEEYRARTAALLAELEQLPVEPDQPARIVIDEGAGIIVMGENVRISKVAVAQGNLTVRVTEAPQVSQPQPFSDGTTVEVPRTNVAVDEQSGRKMAILEGGVTLDQLVDGLNALGVGPRDMIAIIQAIRAAGALQAEIEVM
ncbi:MAG TPA: flagellar biosynthesis protein FlgA, partial [Rhodospirillales bacterium]|nr:flagellar biosynthesis protein FlgA [Rhodospirillales bacterium]